MGIKRKDLMMAAIGFLSVTVVLIFLYGLTWVGLVSILLVLAWLGFYFPGSKSSEP